MSDASATELLRLQCLQTMGIAVYHPRFRLPGAKPSVLGAWPAAASAAPVAKVSAPAAEPAPVPVKAAVREAAVRELPLRERAGAAPPAAARQVVQDSTQEPVQQFQLLFLQVDDDLAILNQIPALARPQLQDKQLALLTNLLRWLGKPPPAHTPRMFRWPLPGLESIAASMQPDTSLLHFLEQASTERGFRFLLAMGPRAATPAAPAWQAFATHSLDEMLALPALKREAWQSLLPLHALLHAGS